MSTIVFKCGEAVEPSVRPPMAMLAHWPHKWSCKGLPSGLRCDPVTGELTGTPTQKGSGTGIWDARNDVADNASSTFSWKVE